MDRRAAHHREHRPHFVYRIFDGDECVYIGCTFQPEKRIRLHAKRYWWPTEPSVKLVGPFVGANARSRAMRRERDLIQRERPRWNCIHNPEWVPIWSAKAMRLAVAADGASA